MNYFFDTCSLLLKADNLFADYANDNIYFSSISLAELEHIKISSNKDNEIKYQARKLARRIDENYDKCHVITYTPSMALENADDTNDLKIIACAVSILKDVSDLIFVSNDICCKHLARQYLKNVESIQEIEDEYDGYLEVSVNDERLADFYQNINENTFNLNINQYIVIKDTNGAVKDIRCWTGETHRYLKYDTFDSAQFGKVSPLKNDPYQKIAFDSLWNNDLTMLSGKPGSGKSMLALSSLFSFLEHGKIDRIYIFVNPAPVRDASQIGFLKGDKDEKLMDGGIGAILSTKLGSMERVQELIESEQLFLIPIVNSRGISIPEHSGVFFTESQNSTADLMKLVLQRCEENVKIVIDGDYNCQLDSQSYAGDRNGMLALSKAFRGADFYGEVKLKTIHRSKICERADLM